LKISKAHSSTSNRPYCPPGYVEHEDTAGNLVPGDWRLQSADAIQNIHSVGSNTCSPSAADLRDTLNELLYISRRYGTMADQACPEYLNSKSQSIMITNI